jgi:hypothetical protein
LILWKDRYHRGEFLDAHIKRLIANPKKDVSEMNLHERITLKGEIEKYCNDFVSYTSGWNITDQERREFADGFKSVDSQWPYKKRLKKQLSLF